MVIEEFAGLPLGLLRLYLGSLVMRMMLSMSESSIPEPVFTVPEGIQAAMLDVGDNTGTRRSARDQMSG